MFSEEDRAIFGYHDGTKDVFGDPLELHRRLNEALEYQAAEVCEQARSEFLPTADAAHKKLVAAAANAFRLVSFDPATGQGCTERMAMKVYNAFIEHIDGLKKKAGNSPSSPPPSPGLPPGFYPEKG